MGFRKAAFHPSLPFGIIFILMPLQIYQENGIEMGFTVYHQSENLCNNKIFLPSR
jgi:hypothetical protein